MSKSFVILVITFMSFTNSAPDPVERIGVKGPLTFSKTSFNLAWTSKPSPAYYVQEYLPKGETPERFNQMMSIFLLVGDTEPKEALQQKVNELDARKKTDPTCNYMVTQSPDKKEYMLDFLLGESRNGNAEIQEFNIYRYKQVELASKKKALLLYAFSKRAYGNDITPFLKNLKAERTKLLHEMAIAKMPEVNVNDK